MMSNTNATAKSVEDALAPGVAPSSSASALAGLYTWGSNAQGVALQTNSVGANVASPMYVGSALANIQGGQDFACAAIGPNPYNVVCWGTNAEGQAGNSSPYPYSALPSIVDFSHTEDPYNPQTLAVGGGHGCVIVSEDSGMMCWGLNDQGQLGNGLYADAAYAVPVHDADMKDYSYVLVAGNKHTCSITWGTLLYCWGSNAAGQLGTGNPDESWSVPVEVAAPAAEPNIYWYTVAAGLSNTCAISQETGAVYCWGAAATGTLGSNNLTANQYVPAESMLTLKSQNPTLASCGGTFFAMESTGDLYVWGDNSHGQAGLGLDAATVPAPVLLASDATAVAAGLNFACMLSGASGAQELSCFGDNSLGQLGDGGAVLNSNVPVVVSASELGEWTSIGASYDTIFAYQSFPQSQAADFVASKIVRKAVKSMARQAEALAPAAVEPAPAPQSAVPAQAPQAAGPASNDGSADDASISG
ncbi:hypothetical protein H632_c170p1 [Helicosporidium sp. ATCC 50920]|nr:hypothetical protein H632_c170p1 [Helicosporidium sp. ATCC 50920]|eukprot:KDD76588.1 hypothetical protein H632_c170p1 [Helicosporidium sp. ATCC 50920]